MRRLFYVGFRLSRAVLCRNIFVVGHPVFLVGKASEIGAVQGDLQRVVLCERIHRTLRRAEESDAIEMLQSRVERFAQTLEEIAPHWIEEARGMSTHAGVEPWQLLALNCLPPDFWGVNYIAVPTGDSQMTRELVDVYDAQGVEPGLGGECTSFFALGDATVAGETLLHKNREERDEVQCAYIKGVTQKYRFVGGGDIGNLGTAHLHTENFWAGANNTGSDVLPDEYQDCALSDSHALRWLGENCRTLDDIVPALENLIAHEYLSGGGHEKGSIWMFADAARGLVVEATSRHMAHQWFEGDAQVVRTNHFVFPALHEYSCAPHPGSVTRLERATEMWESQHGLAGLSLCGEIARDRRNAPHAICRNARDKLGSVSVSTSTATISSHDDARCQTHFRNGHPRFTPGVILTPLDRVSDSDLVSGAHNQQSRRYRNLEDDSAAT